MACLVADGAKYVARVGRGAHRAQTSMRAAGPPILFVKKTIQNCRFSFIMACLVVDDAKCLAGMGRGAHRARTSWATPRREGPPYLSEAMPC
eukprot:7940092-Pyramimonas_sp.AAC.1